MKRLIAFVFFLFFISCAQVAGAAQINWHTLEDAKKIAASQNKKIYINFHAEWCKYCHLLEDTTFKDYSVIRYLNDHFVCVRVDTVKNKKLAAKFRVRGLPANWFLTSKGKKLGNLPGYYKPADFKKKLEYIYKERYRK